MVTKTLARAYLCGFMQSVYTIDHLLLLSLKGQLTQPRSEPYFLFACTHKKHPPPFTIKKGFSGNKEGSKKEHANFKILKIQKRVNA